MNILPIQTMVRHLWRLAAVAVLLMLARSVPGAEPSQPARYLLVFETSPTVKKNLPMVKESLAKLFASSFQNEIETDDDLGVWTVDQTLHTGAFPLASWSPEEAEDYAVRLTDFLDRQKYTRHANLTAIQPLLNRVVKSSEKLTVIIFCDSQSRLLGTPYDSGVNETITNTALKAKNGPVPIILTLRSYHGEYLGCSVNRGGALNMPKFPPPPAPKLEPPPLAKTPPPTKPPVVVQLPSMIIVGTNAATNLPPVKPPTAAAPVPPTNAVPADIVVAGTPATPVINPPPAAAVTPPPAPAPAPVVAPKVVAAAPSNPPAQPPPTVTPTPTPAPAPVAVQPGPAPTPVAPPTDTASTSTLAGAVSTAPEANTGTEPTADKGYLWAATIGGGALIVAGGLVAWLVARARRPRGSLITSSMLNDPRQPPRK